MKLKFIYLFVLSLLAIKGFSCGILLKAEDDEGKIMHFVPSQHDTSAALYDQIFLNKICMFDKLVFEKYNVHSTPKDAELYSIKFISEKFIKSINGFVLNSEDQWSLEQYPDIEKNIKHKFMDIKNNLASKIDLSHFDDIYSMKPGVVAALYYYIADLNGPKGIESFAANSFRASNKQITSVENDHDVIESLRLHERKIFEISDDFLNPNVYGNYPSTLEVMHNKFTQCLNERRLGDEQSLSIRNKAWVPSCEKLKGSDCVALFGYLHFPGKEGLINLLQIKGWKCSIWRGFDEKGKDIYQPFTYEPMNEKQSFRYNYLQEQPQ